MKTIGEILRQTLETRGISEEKLSQLTRIDIRYIQALESNDFKHLPPVTFTKGFVRNLSLALGKDPDEWIALLRRDYQLDTPKTISTFHRPSHFSFASLFQSQILLVLAGALIFLGYLGFQYRAVIAPPPLAIVSPVQDAVIASPVSLEGITSPGNTVVINDGLKVTPDASGHFSARLNLSPGQNDIKVSATNRFSRTTAKTISVTIVSQ